MHFTSDTLSVERRECDAGDQHENYAGQTYDDEKNDVDETASKITSFHYSPHGRDARRRRAAAPRFECIGGSDCQISAPELMMNLMV